MEYRVTMHNEMETIELAQNFESEKFPNMIICLNGELGSGKTMFTKGIANALGIEETITSPTFTIIKEYEKSKKRYGSPKITKILNKQGIKVSQKRVARRMKALKLRSITVKKFNHNGNKKVNDENKENLLAQNFKAEKPSEKWVGDITYIYTKETGWTYLAIVMDLFDLKIIGWSYGENMTAELVISAFKKAKIARGVTKGMIFHSDLGSQYTSNEYEKILLENNVKHSYSKKGYPYDNASKVVINVKDFL